MPKIVTREHVQAVLGDPKVVLVEALPPSYYEKEHLPGALNLPHDQVDELAGSLIPDKASPVIVYCANGPCPNSGIAAQRLQELGYTDVSDYDLGKEDWFAAGLPFESGSAPGA